MRTDNKYEREVLEYLLKTRDDPDEVRQSGRARSLVSYAVGAAAMLAAAYFLKPVGIERWALLGLAAFGGVLITYGAIHEPLRKQYEVLHEFIDFDRVRAKLEGR